MRLSPKELEKLALHGAGFLAQKRLWRGLRLNYPESIALIAAQLLEFIRDGESVSGLMDKGKHILGMADVMPGVAEMIHDVQVEGTFPDGVKLVTVHNPICAAKGSMELALYGSGLDPAGVEARRKAVEPSPAHEDPATAENPVPANPGGYILEPDDIQINAGREAISLEVANMGDRPVQVGSHYPFFETNASLSFDRARAFGRRLDIPSGTAVRFEPGESKKVALVPVAGERVVFGGNGLISGRLGDAARETALRKAADLGFLNVPEEET